MTPRSSLTRRTWSDQQDDCLMNVEQRVIELEREMSTEQEELSRGILRSDPHIRESLEQKIDRLEREKQLLHERVEELERVVGLDFGKTYERGCSPIGSVLVPPDEYESLKADAEAVRQPIKHSDPPPSFIDNLTVLLPEEFLADLGVSSRMTVRELMVAANRLYEDSEKWRKLCEETSNKCR